MGGILGHNVLMALAQVLDTVLSLYKWIIIIRALLSFVNPDPYNPIVRFLYQITEPVLYWVRRNLPVVFGGLDFSPLVIIFAIQFLQIALVKTLVALAMGQGG